MVVVLPNISTSKGREENRGTQGEYKRSAHSGRGKRRTIVFPQNWGRVIQGYPWLIIY